MVSNLIVFAVVLWAAVYCGFKLKKFITDAGSEKPVKCSCSSCPYVDNKA